MPTTNKKLLLLIHKHKLSSQDVADALHVTRSAVEKWRQAEGNQSHNAMPEGLLELLEIKLLVWDIDEEFNGGNTAEARPLTYLA